MNRANTNPQSQNQHQDTQKAEENQLRIPADTDWNHEDGVSQNGDGTGIAFPAEVYENLPEPLRSLSLLFTDRVEQEVFLVGALGVISGILPNVIGRYGGNEYAPNLYTYVLAPYGEGKGTLMYARLLAEPIHQARLEAAKLKKQEYQTALLQYEKDKKLFAQGKITEAPLEPEQPSILMTFIPANNTKSGLAELLMMNEGRGILFETEGDTLADALKQEHGNFSDILRKASQHEPVEFYRRTNREQVRIPRPCLSVVLSSTPDQLLKLIPTPENGLFSRFLFYQATPNPAFADVFDTNKNRYRDHVQQVAAGLQNMHAVLDQLPHPLEFSLTQAQRKQFRDAFTCLKVETTEDAGAGLSGTIHRLALNCFRIAMQLTVLRWYADGCKRKDLICSEQDFANALRMTQVFAQQSFKTYCQLMPVKAPTPINESKEAEVMAQKVQCRQLRAQGYTIRMIAQLVLKSETKHNTVWRWLKE